MLTWRFLSCSRTSPSVNSVLAAATGHENPFLLAFTTQDLEPSSIPALRTQ